LDYRRLDEIKNEDCAKQGKRMVSAWCAL